MRIPEGIPIYSFSAFIRPLLYTKPPLSRNVPASIPSASINPFHVPEHHKYESQLRFRSVSANSFAQVVDFTERELVAGARHTSLLAVQQILCSLDLSSVEFAFRG